ncbi:tRNA lysidine(34) synthetase TilS [Chitinivibrio alkaliphilus]|uniref:tRNA(Ile)-lysidine synthase n=1 Tax=Chitinivibrio alkaliphilus ACht1 TaxID=1313304 RepID=U7DC16_9BACT|nr:tRNA lysidine(34) synthetase TilS [Chitinivibrio alkaliphilus]ERP31955.1 tRNA(Ile)-lysidine synthase [Chitinivibrio alkaliphilus ACht1]
MILSTISEFLTRYKIYNTGLGVAVSSGADSTALLHGLWSLQKEFGLTLFPLHVNYNLRGDDSREDLLFLKDLTEKLSLQFLYREYTHLSYNDTAIEEKARTLRYAFFKEMSHEKDISFIAVGHTQNDTVETILFRLLRGTGLYGARGIDSYAPPYIRPLISVSRTAILEYLHTNSIPWREDTSNQDTKYSRNALRHKVVPLLQEINPRAVENIARFGKSLQEYRQYEEQEYHHWKNTHCLFFEPARALIIQRNEKPYNPFLCRLFREFGTAIEERHLQIIHRAWNIPGVRSYPFPEDTRLHMFQNILLLSRKKSFRLCDKKEVIRPQKKTLSMGGGIQIHIARGDTTLTFDKTNNRVYINIQNFPLLVRSTEKGDRITPFGKTREYTVEELLKKAGVPRIIRNNYPVITTEDNTIVWVPAIAFSAQHRISTHPIYTLTVESAFLTTMLSPQKGVE